MSKFASDELEQIDLGDGEWVKIPKIIAWDVLQAARKAKGEKGDEEVGINMISRLVRDWSWKEKGKKVDIIEKNVKRMNVLLLDKITDILMKKIIIKKKD